MTWPRPLAHFLEHRSKPVCPTFCPYREYCSEWIQKGINQSFVQGRITRCEECFIFEGLAQLTRDRLGVEPPDSAEGFFELVAEREGMKEAS